MQTWRKDNGAPLHRDAEDIIVSIGQVSKDSFKIVLLVPQLDKLEDFQKAGESRV